MHLLVLTLGLLFLIVIEVLRVYFIMPFPGSQQSETIAIAYFLDQYILWLRLAGLLVVASPLYKIFRSTSRPAKITVGVGLIVYVVVFYLFNFRFLADKMFLMPETTAFAQESKNKLDRSKLVVGITSGSVSKAYPIEIIGYHHQVNGEPVMITYCTVCRTGRVYRPVVNGKTERFRLVGMDHFNAMFEDSSTHSWWRQVNGEAIAGPLKGTTLEEFPSEQMTLAAWLFQHPDSWIMQEDPVFAENYDKMKNFDEGKSKGDLTRRDSLSWREKSWVLGVQTESEARAYDWNDLQQKRVVNDRMGALPVAVMVEKDSASFHAFSRMVGSDTLAFAVNSAGDGLIDDKTQSAWNWNGVCTSGTLAGSKLTPVRAYQEFWHSWRTFHPNTSRYTD